MARDVIDLRPARDARRRDDRVGGSGADGRREAVLGYFEGEVVVGLQTIFVEKKPARFFRASR